MQNIHVLRLHPGSDLKRSIQEFVTENKIVAGWIGSCIGSLTCYNIRFANRKIGHSLVGHFEILALSGTLSVNGSHLHICISDVDGNCTGGHLLEGCIIYTTAEIVLQSTDEWIFKRKKDVNTGYEELDIEKQAP